MYMIEGKANDYEKAVLLEKWVEGKLDCTMSYLEEAFGTQDFTSALYDAANVALMQGYGEVDPVWKLACKVVSRKDFNTNYVVTAGGMGLLHKRVEHEPATEQKPTDRKESYAIAPYDAVFGISMEAQANDATGILLDQFRNWGQSAVNTLNDFVWGTSGLLGGTGSGGTLSDGYVMFSTSHTNSNYTSSGLDLNYEGLQTAYTAMREQPDEGGTQIAGVKPRYLFYEPALHAEAVQLCQSPLLMARGHASTSALTQGGTNNPFRGLLEPVMIDTLATGEWVLGADPNLYPCCEMGFLNGRTEPQIMFLPPDSEAEFWTRTRYSKCQLVFGGRQLSWKTYYKGIA